MVSCQSEPKKILIVVTNQSDLVGTGLKTGYYLPEVSHPYYKFKKAGLLVDFASPKGGVAPMDPKSLDLKDPLNKKFYENKELMGQLKNTLSLKNVNPKEYKAIVFAGGHGTMWDFADSEAVSKVSREIYESGGVVAAVCHGPAALVNIKLSNGDYLIKGKKVTGFTNVEEDIVELSKFMPFMLEDKLKERGAKFESANAWNEKVVVDGRIVTGQNPASASELGSKIVELLK
ncbi:type 1 glutamine amidotransferase domain-containing protein [Halobacteriovorax marinus]|uniref:Type 1 glutamine amidotransferase domain-containing protein n=1 Tax=Halobacteriovorax marinus TaxID=97084 RepID=A0A1Y5F5E4_9BACT|nr:type 1 glutamine amidotransferase domain-containing protein [Halobacteriovorax marinus]